MKTCTFTPVVSDILGLAFWLFLAGVRLAQAWQERSLLAVLLTVQAGLAAYGIAGRRNDVAQIPWKQKAVAWLSALLPLALQVEGHMDILSGLVTCSGLLLAAWSLLSLGRSFGIAPADRGLVQVGPYRLLRHPMYAGELLAVFGASCTALTPWNLGLWAVLLFSIWLRIRWEERTVGGYTGYARRVRWRLLPGVW